MTDNTKMREAFEKWAEGKDLPITQWEIERHKGEYWNDFTQFAWRAWQAGQMECKHSESVPEEKPDFEKLESLGWQIAVCAMCGTHASAIKPVQSVPVGMRVSVDTSTGEHDAGNRVFAVVTGQQDDGRGGLMLLCEEESRNFEQSVPVVGEPVAFGSGDKIVDVGTYKNVPAVFVMPAPIVGVVGERAGDIYSKDSIIAGEFVLTFPTGHQAQAVADALCNATCVMQAELDAKDARIRELEEANASLEASYRGSCMMYDATKVELKALRKDAERYRWIRSASVGPATVWHVCMEHLEGGLLTLKSDYCLDTAIDSAMQEHQS
jgi:hypothetical protein